MHTEQRGDAGEPGHKVSIASSPTLKARQREDARRANPKILSSEQRGNGEGREPIGQFWGVA